MPIDLIIIILLLFMSGFFSCSETSLFSLSRSEVAKFKSSQNPFAKSIITALSKPRQLLVSILLGNELVNVAIAVLVAGFLYGILGDIAWQAKVIISIAISTPLIVVIGEVIPKNIGIRYASSMAYVCVIFINIFSRIFAPLRWLLLKLAEQFISWCGGQPKEVRSMIMEEELRSMVEIGAEEGYLDEAESELIHNVFDLSDKTVESIMTPKEAIFSVSLNDNISGIMPQVRHTKFSRIPVYDADPDDIVGILHIRDLFSIMRRRSVTKIRDVENIIRPVYFAPLSTTLEQMLTDFQRMKVHMAVVVDNKRRPVGVVTMEDMFKALFEGE